MMNRAFRAAEFFAGIGLVRLALEPEGFTIAFANDISPAKATLYSANFDAAHFVLGDVRNLTGGDVPDCDVATASFPCTDLSLAGNRAGLNGKQSAMFWEFARILEQMGSRRPRAVLLENVVGFATSRNGADLASAVERLNQLGYSCDIFTADARWFVPQSRPRLFIVGSDIKVTAPDTEVSLLRPDWIWAFIRGHADLEIQCLRLCAPSLSTRVKLVDCLEQIPLRDARWWDDQRVSRFVRSLSEIQCERLNLLQHVARRTWATAYRRTRNGRAVWEIRADDISGCLRTMKGGSGRQAVVQAGRGNIRVRWMTAREYANLQGARDFRLDGSRETDAISAFGDGVCVPLVAWIAREYLRPLLEGALGSNAKTDESKRDHGRGQVEGHAAGNTGPANAIRSRVPLSAS